LRALFNQPVGQRGHQRYQAGIDKVLHQGNRTKATATGMACPFLKLKANRHNLLAFPSRLLYKIIPAKN
jgi:hypothetical protein